MCGKGVSGKEAAPIVPVDRVGDWYWCRHSDLTAHCDGITLPTWYAAKQARGQEEGKALQGDEPTDGKIRAKGREARQQQSQVQNHEVPSLILEREWSVGKARKPASIKHTHSLHTVRVSFHLEPADACCRVMLLSSFPAGLLPRSFVLNEAPKAPNTSHLPWPAHGTGKTTRRNLDVLARAVGPRLPATAMRGQQWSRICSSTRGGP